VSTDMLVADLLAEIERIPLIDSHSHIDPLAPTSRSLDDILSYHYYTELAHSSGMSHAPLAPDVPPRQRVRAILEHLERFDNTAQASWLREIVRVFLDEQVERIDPADADWLFDASERIFGKPDWEEEVLRRSGIERVFLTNEFDDPLERYNTRRYVPCLRTDTIVFGWQNPSVQQRLAQTTGVEVGDAGTLRVALAKVFERFVAHGAKACAISLPPDFVPRADATAGSPPAVFWMVAQMCREHRLPFDLMIGVNRNVYRGGVHQGRDLFDQRTSLIQYAELFNAFPEVMFPVSVLTSVQNQELVSYAWIFPNVLTHGHWWYSNIPVYIADDLRARLQAVPKIKQLGYYSDMYKLEFGLPKFAMYRRILARVLADDLVRPKLLSETQALELARLLLRDNVQRIFGV